MQLKGTFQCPTLQENKIHGSNYTFVTDVLYREE